MVRPPDQGGNKRGYFCIHSIPFRPSIDFADRALAHVWTLDDDSRHILLVHVEERGLPREPTINSRFIHNSEDFGEDLLERNESLRHSMFGRFGWPF